MTRRELSPYALVLREHGEGEEAGYSMELAPQPGACTSPRAHGGGSSSSRAAAATRTPPPRARGSRSAGAEDWAASPRTHGGSTSTAGRSPRAHRGSSAAGRSPRAHRGSSAAGRSPRAHGRTSARRAATGTPPRAHASIWGTEARGCVPWRRPTGSPPARARSGAATATDGGDDAAVEDPGVDHTAAARGRILREMRDLLNPSCIAGEESSKNGGSSSKNVREIVIPVFLAPKKKADNKKDEIWNKRQIIYGIALLGPLGLVLSVASVLPQWMIFLFTVVWGFGSVGFPMGLYGTSRCEMDCSRHFARLIFMGFSLFVIYIMYQSVLLLDTSSPSSSPPSAATDMAPPAAPPAWYVDLKWTLAFGILGAMVMGGHIYSWVRGCLTGSDRDLDESVSNGEELSDSDDLLERFWDRS